MNQISSTSNAWQWLQHTLSYCRNHFLPLITLGLIAGIGRVAQLRGFGPVSPTMNTALELIVEGSRIALFIYILVSASKSPGFSGLRAVLSGKEKRRQLLQTMSFNLRRKWPVLLLNLPVFAAIAWIINVAIDKLAYETCFYLAMQQRGILGLESSEWTVILFFKNITVIPLTFVFMAMLLLLLAGKLRPR